MLCILYLFATSACLSVAGALLEYALPPGASRRWLWSATIVVSVALPIWTILFHTASGLQLWGHIVVDLSHRPATGGGSLGTTGWLMSDAFYHQFIKPVLFLSSFAITSWGAASALWLRRLVRAVRSTTVSDQQYLVDGIPVTVTESLGPATVGFWRSQLVVPRWVFALPARQQAYLLRHEQEHYRANDSRLLAAASILVGVFAFNLPLWWQLWRLRLAVETDCDRRVVAALGGRDVYGELLLNVAVAASRSPQIQPALLGRPGMLERRLSRLLVEHDPSFRRRLVAVVAGCLVLAITISVSHPVRSRDSGRGRTLIHALRHSAH